MCVDCGDFPDPEFEAFIAEARARAAAFPTAVPEQSRTPDEQAWHDALEAHQLANLATKE